MRIHDPTMAFSGHSNFLNGNTTSIGAGVTGKMNNDLIGETATLAIA